MKSASFLCRSYRARALGMLIQSKQLSLTTFSSSKRKECKTTGIPRIPIKCCLPTRAQQLKELASGKEYDVLVIGGGATGCGCALDAITRGLRTALVEADDFASGTSSRSTKLIHGGIRYLQKAIMQLNYKQYAMVSEALRERAIMLESAPHLNRPLPILLPVYHWWQLPYFWFGIKCYDFIACSKGIGRSYVLSSKRALQLFPMLKKEGLCGGIVYYDGQMDDTRMCLAVAMTAAKYGANVCNYLEVINLLSQSVKGGKKQLCGVEVRDMITGNKFCIRAKCIINATGPFTDSIRAMDDSNAEKICAPSSGVHVTLPDYFSSTNIGLLEPATSDGRVVFILPWQGKTIAGTTDEPTKVTTTPEPTEKEIEFILTEVAKFLNDDFRLCRNDVLSAWSGIRPLVYDPNSKNTESLARNHIVHVSENKLVTVAGGKWTTYRAMAEHTIDEVLKQFKLNPISSKSITASLKMDGAQCWTPTTYVRLVQEFGLETEVAQHLSNYYGNNATKVLDLAKRTKKRWPRLGVRLHPLYPFIEAEVLYGVREYACTPIDMIARRLRLCFLDSQTALEVLPTIIAIMGKELKWSQWERQRHHKAAVSFLKKEMGLQ